MKKIILLVMAVLMISLLSGCIDQKWKHIDKINSNNETSSGVKSDYYTSENIPENTTNDTGSVLKVLNSSSNDIGSTDTEGIKENNSINADNPGWCRSGSKISVKMQDGEKYYDVVGITTYQGREVCKAELVVGNMSSTKYYSEDGKFDAMTSSSSGSGSLSVESSTHANSS